MYPELISVIQANAGVNISVISTLKRSEKISGAARTFLVLAGVHLLRP